MSSLSVTTLRRALAFLVVVGVLLFPISSAFAEGAITFTETFHNVTESFSDVNACTGDPATVTHSGDFVCVPDDPSLPTNTGRFTIWAGFNSNNQNAAGTFTFTAHGTGSDGSEQ